MPQLPETDIRIPLCQLLQEYITRHPERSQIARRIQNFVQTTPECLQRSHQAGHITGSAWLLNPTVTEMEIYAPLVAKKAQAGQIVIVRATD